METVKRDYSSAISRVKEIITSDSPDTQVLCVYGGDKRTRKRFGEEINKEISAETNRIIDFDIPSYESVPEQLARLSIIIRSVQKQEKMFPCFDYAYIQYMRLRGYDVKRASKKNSITDNSFYKLAISIAKIWFLNAIPVSEILETIKAAVECYEQVREKQEQNKYQNIREEIDKLAQNPVFLTEMLPKYFANDLNTYLKNSQSFILHLDSYFDGILKEEDDWLLGEYGVAHYIKGTKWLIMSGKKWNYTNKDSSTCFTEISLNEITSDILNESEPDIRPSAVMQQMDDFQREMFYVLDCLGMWNEYVIREILVGERTENLSVYLSLRNMLGHFIRTERAVCSIHITEEVTLEEYPYEKRILLLKKMETILSGKDSQYFSEKEKLLYFRICFHIMEGMGDEWNEPLLECLNEPFMDVARYLLEEHDGEELCKFCEQAERIYRKRHNGILYQLLILRYCAQVLCETDTASTENMITRMSNEYSLRGELDYPLEAVSAGIAYMYRMNLYREMNFLSESASRIMYRRHLYYQYCAVNAKAKSYIGYDQIEEVYLKCYEELAEELSIEQIEEQKRKIVDMRHAVKNSTPDEIEKAFGHLYKALQSARENPLYLDLLDVMTDYYISASLNVDKEQMKSCLKKYMGELKCMGVQNNKAKEIYMVKRASYYDGRDEKIQEIHELIEIMADTQEKYKSELYLHYSEISRILATINFNVTTWTELGEGTGGIGDDRKKFESVFLAFYELYKKEETIDFELLAALRRMAEVNCCYFAYVPWVVMHDIDMLMKKVQTLNADQILRALGMFHAGWGIYGLTGSKEKNAPNLPPEKKRGALYLEKYFEKYKQCFNRLYQILQEKYEEEMQKYIRGKLPKELADRYRQFLVMVFSGAEAGDEEKAYEILSMLDIDCEAEKRAARKKTDTTAIECPKAETLSCIMSYSFSKKENYRMNTKKLITGVIKGWNRLWEEYGEAYVKDILVCAENYENDKWHESFGFLPKKLKNEILVQKGRK